MPYAREEKTCAELSIVQHFSWNALCKTVHDIFPKRKYWQCLKRLKKQYRKVSSDQAESKPWDIL